MRYGILVFGAVHEFADKPTTEGGQKRWKIQEALPRRLEMTCRRLLVRMTILLIGGIRILAYRKR